MADPSPICSAVGGIGAGNNSCALSPPASPIAVLKDWEYLLNERPTAQKDMIKQRFPDNSDPGYHAIEDGLGPCNLDCYLVAIPQLPTLPALGQLTPELLFNYIRTNLATLLDNNIAILDAVETQDSDTWRSDAPLGAVMRFQMEAASGLKDVAGVVCSEYNKGDSPACPDHSRGVAHWIFSTLPLPRPHWYDVMSAGAHPVAGNRQFGLAYLRAGQSLPDIYQKSGISIDNSSGDALYFYTRGVDRVSNVFHFTMGAGGSIVFAGGHACWLSLQQGVANFVTQNGGTALSAGFISQRWDWDSLTAPDGLWHKPAR